MMIRLIPQLRDPVDPRELHSLEEIVQARIDGAITRRQLIQRAAQIGIAAPVVGVMLHATSDMVAGAPSQGRERTLALLRQETVQVSGPTAPAGTKVQGGTLVSSTLEEPDTLHPYITALVTTSDVLNGILDPLLRYDSNQQIIPNLAESYTISEDGLTYTFKLRQGVTFHNGEPFTARDVVSVWKIITNPDFGAIADLGWKEITDIQTPDDHTAVMVTGSVYAPFITYVGADIGGSSMMCPTSAIEKGPAVFTEEFGRQPIGTGPFQLGEWRAKEQITLTRFDGYWGERPALDQIVHRIIGDDNSQIVQLQTKEVQMAAGSGTISSARVDEVLKFEDVAVLESPNMAWNHLDLKHVDFLRMTKVRQALDFATPTQDIIDRILLGRAVRAVADQAPFSQWFNPNIQPRPYDPEQAKALLTEAGLTQGEGGVWEGPTPAPEAADPNTDLTGPVKRLELEFWYISGDSVTERIAQVIAQAWNQIGIKTELKSEDVSTIFGPEGYTFTETMTAGMYSWFNGNDPADSYYYWHSASIPDSPTGTGGNTPAYFHKFNFQDEIDPLLDEGGRETDPEKRKQIYWKVQEILAREVPVVFLWWGKDFSAVSSKVGGFWPSAFNRLMWNAQQWYLVE
jgi:peptide/nickel transport system substrate-binding protein